MAKDMKKYNTDNKGMTMKKAFVASAVLLAVALLSYGSADAKVTGPCANCHTMHNSQNGANVSAAPKEALLNTSCFGCHSTSTGSSIINNTPMVYHNGGTDLAGGNFKYIETDSNRGHNVRELNIQDPNITGTPTYVPGNVSASFHQQIVTGRSGYQWITCAGSRGCHGFRDAGLKFTEDDISLAAMKGAHHADDAVLKFGTINEGAQGATVGTSYRFLDGVKGGEVGDWKNSSSSHHNEYFGTNTPPTYSCSTGVACHPAWGATMPVKSYNGGMSGFCGTCHGNFHTLSGSLGSGIGTSTNSPFQRHPTDIVLPNKTEYAAYTSFSAEAPVARTVIPNAIGGTVTPGTDVVMCLSCHGAHATSYKDMLRWDYNGMVANGGGSGGCFTCHTQKN